MVFLFVCFWANFASLSRIFFGIGATIHIGREILCLPLAEFVVSHEFDKTLLKVKYSTLNNASLISLLDQNIFTAPPLPNG